IARRGSPPHSRPARRRRRSHRSSYQPQKLSSRPGIARMQTANRLTKTVIAGLVPVIHARNTLLTSPVRFGAAEEWNLGTSPRMTTGVVGRAGGTVGKER